MADGAQDSAMHRLHPLLAKVVVCPACRGSLTVTDEDLVCAACQVAYPINDGVPVLLVDEGRRLDAGDADDPAKAKE